jgi:response regulator of citrate/malate metabolism
MSKIKSWHESCRIPQIFGELYVMERVLVLTEDEQLFFKLKKKFREGPEIQIVTCTDSLNLIENYTSQHSELVILDIDMIKTGVGKLINILRSIKKNVQFILILSKENMSICSDVLSLGVVSYLIKPVSIDNLGKIVLATLKIKI